MNRNLCIEPPFFEIGPKNYLFGDQVVELARIADEAAVKYDVRVIFTAPYVNIERIAATTKNIYVFAPHMDSSPIGRGLANVLPESLKAAGAKGVMLNHVERPLSLQTLHATLARARQVGLMSIVCADSLGETKAVAALGPDMMVTEPADVIASANAVGVDYVKTSVEAVMAVNPNIGILVGGGIHSGKDVYDIIYAGADATGSSSGIVTAPDPGAMVHEMLQAVREAWNDREGGK